VQEVWPERSCKGGTRLFLARRCEGGSFVKVKCTKSWVLAKVPGEVEKIDDITSPSLSIGHFWLPMGFSINN
jgi:hypothetical protein